MAEVLALRDAAAAADPPLHAAIVEALEVIGRALHVYPVPTLVLSFNGGKDSTVVLHLLRAALLERERARAVAAATCAPAAEATVAGAVAGAVPAVYFESAGNFPEVLEFMTATALEYGFAVRTVPEFKRGLAALRAEGVQAVIIGTRRTDPHGGSLHAFTPTTLNWPPAMRVCPILSWSYRMVWAFLRGARLPYCPLYDRGYTSLGSVADSVPNPRLRQEPASDGGRADSAAFLPAYMLGDDGAERLGRGAAGASVAAAPASGARPPRAAIVIIGDEVLSGRVRDANGPFLCANLSARGVEVVEVAVVLDEVPDIAAAVSRLAPQVDWLFTCGGLGPTHDDVTMKGVAAAFRYPLATCAELARFLELLYDSTRHDGAAGEADKDSGARSVFLRMAVLPVAPDVHLCYADGTDAVAFPERFHSATAGADATGTGVAGGGDEAALARGYPLVRVRNVHVFPGVPAIVRRKWRAHASAFTGPDTATTLLAVEMSEPQLAEHLEAVLRETADESVSAAAGTEPAVLRPRVKLGSYPPDTDPFAAVYASGISPGMVSPAITPGRGLAAAGCDDGVTGAGAGDVSRFAGGGAVPMMRLPESALVAAAAGAPSRSGAPVVSVAPPSPSGVTISVSATGAGAAEAVAAAVTRLRARFHAVGASCAEAPLRLAGAIG